MQLDAGAVVIDHRLECREPAVVHVGCGELDIAQRRRFEVAQLPGIERDLADAAVAAAHRRVQAVVPRPIHVEVRRLASRQVAAGAALEEQRLAAVLLGAEVVEVGAYQACPGQPVIIFRPAGHQRTQELRHGPGQPRAGDLLVAKSLLEQARILLIAAEGRDHGVELLPHFGLALDGPQDLVLQRGSAFVPEEAPARIEGHVGQARRMTVGQRPREALADAIRIDKGMFLLVSRSACGGVVGGQPGH